ncbi:MAG: leucine-rich repeat domain-containing protein [Clostridiales bacterium]|nr:leucine-rich repeat domain-containing protein [Clostridiales bacterium]
MAKTEKKNKKKKGAGKNSPAPQNLEKGQGVAKIKNENVDAKKKAISIEEKMATMDEADFWGSFVEYNPPKADTAYSVSEQNQFLGRRAERPFSNSILLYDRFHYKRAAVVREALCTALLEKDTGKSVGLLPRFPLTFVWRTAHTATRGNVEQTFGITGREWLHCVDALTKYIEKTEAFQKNAKGGQPVLVQDLFDLTESEYEELFLPKGKEAIDVVKAAVEQDIAESVCIEQKWKKIWRYPYKVSLLKTKGGLFSKNDAAILRRAGIRYLNDIRKSNIYKLKNLFLDHYLQNIVEEINAAFKEDHERRLDTRLKVYPFVFGGAAMLTSAAVGYIYQYRLLKNTPMTVLIFAMLGVWLACVGMVIWAGKRTKYRKLKRPEYVYYTRDIRRVILALSIFSLFSIGSVSFFYERYDGYNDLLFYRNLKGGNIAVAGLADKSADVISIPETIDGKTVVEIDRGAFFHDKMAEVIIPETVEKIDAHVFVNCRALQKITLPKSISKINKRTFVNCESLKSIQLPEGLTKISKRAFKNCTALTEVQMPETIEVIEDKAFSKCLGLYTVENLSYVKSIGKKAFLDCPLSQEVDLSNAVYIGKNAFKGVWGMSAVTLNPALKTIEKGAFAKCVTMLKVNGLEGVTHIEKNAFKDCIRLVSISSLDSVKQIDKKAFSGCAKLANVTFGSSLQVMKGKAFESCTALTKVTVPNSVQKMGRRVFDDCENLNDLTLPFIGKTRKSSKLYSLHYTIKSRKVDSRLAVTLTDMEKIYSASFKDCDIVKSVAFDEGVTEIQAGAFEGCGLNTLTLPSTLQEIKKETFKDCTNLVSITGGDGITSIAKNAFQNCENLTGVNFQKVTKIGQSAFAGCSALADLGNISNLEHIAENAFAGCASLKAVTLPKSVTTILPNVFTNSGLQTITLSGVTKISNNAFNGCASLTSVEGLQNVEEIDRKAFSGCTKLTNVTFGSALKEIRAKAFENCTSLTQVTIPNSVEKMGRRVFKSCESLNSLSLPFIGKTRALSRFYSLSYTIQSRKADNHLAITLTDMDKVYRSLFRGCDIVKSVTFGKDVTEIQSGAFAGSGLTTIQLPGSLKEIKNNTFKNCKKLVSVTGGENVTTIGKKAFLHCANLNTASFTKLTEVEKSAFKGCRTLSTLGDIPNLQRIGVSAFEGCKGLTAITLSDSLKTIEKNVFKNSGLTSVKFTSGLEKIEKNAFNNCDSLTEADLSNTAVTNIGVGAFSKCNVLASLKLPNGLNKIPRKLAQNCGKLTAVQIGQNTQTIGKKAFANTAIAELIIPEQIEQIGAKAFYGCDKLTTLNIPSTMKRIGRHAFANTDNLVHVKTPFLGNKKNSLMRGFSYVFGREKSLKSLEVTDLRVAKSSTFKGAKNVTKIILNEGVETIKAGAFKGCSLEEMVLPSTLKTIGNKAFAKSQVKQLDLSVTSVSKIGKGAFKDCVKLTTLTLPEGLETIPARMAQGCKALTDVSIPNSVKEIGKFAFENCSKLQALNLSNNVQTIGKGMASYCYNLSEVTLSSALTEISQGAFKHCTSLKEISIPDSITKIAKNAFNSCSALKEVHWGTGLKEIDRKAFNGCALTSLALNDGVEKIGGKAFANNKSLAKVVLPSSLETIGMDILKGCSVESLTLPHIGWKRILPLQISYVTDSKHISSLTITNAKRLANNFLEELGNLRELTITCSLDKVTEDTFAGSEKLTTVRLNPALEAYESFFPEGVVTYIN